MDLTREEILIIKKSAHKYSRNREDAEDIASETMLRLLPKEAHTNRKAYICTALRSTAINFYRPVYQQVTVLKDQFLPHEMPSYLDEYETYDPLWEAITKLPTKQQKAIIYKLLDYKPREIEEVTGCNASTVKANIRHAIKALEPKLKPLYSSPKSRI